MQCKEKIQQQQIWLVYNSLWTDPFKLQYITKCIPINKIYMSTSRAVATKLNTDKIFNVLYQDGKFSKTGIELWSEAGIDPSSLLPKTIKDFESKSQSDEISRMSFVHYEERRQLRLLMISDLYQHIKQLKGQKPDDGLRVNKLTFYNSKSNSKQAGLKLK